MTLSQRSMYALEPTCCALTRRLSSTVREPSGNAAAVPL